MTDMTADMTSDMTSGRLSGQVALITGASSGIGAAIARAFLREGADLVIVARRGERLRAVEDAARALSRRCLVIEGDVRDDETARSAVRAAVDDLGRLDILVNNSGIAYYKPLAETSPEEYDAMMDTNMRGTFLFTRHTVPVFLAQRSGAIINIASMAGVMGFAGEAVYCASKFAQVGFTQALDRELRPHNIKVGAICPGGVKTELAIGTGRTEAGVAASGMLDAMDVAGAALLMATQSAGSRIMEIRLRPMVEPLAGRDPD